MADDPKINLIVAKEYRHSATRIWEGELTSIATYELNADPINIPDRAWAEVLVNSGAFAWYGPQIGQV